MATDMMGVDELAVYLQRDAREVLKMANRGYLPGQKVSGQWRFHPVEINQWIENQMPNYTDKELLAVEAGAAGKNVKDLLIRPLLTEETIAIPLKASTRSSVLKALVNLAEQTWQIYDPDAILAALRQREEMGSTSIHSGIAFPHPHRPLPNTLGDDVIAYGRCLNGIPFGAPSGGLTGHFFLVLCRDSGLHMQVLARLSRMLLRPEFMDGLEEAQTPEEFLHLIEETELEII